MVTGVLQEWTPRGKDKVSIEDISIKGPPEAMVNDSIRLKRRKIKGK